ncbi:MULTISPECIES: amino acid permease [unclassified Corynebacterium]|uniref:amino acid permease n=2 Tax=Corynebacteriaceae TaxID=1653 RepID=UPI00254C22BB|nr:MULTISPECIES: amino acid permease [unclassified Corynebacterium]MDK8467610.1 amino acid permease [Corynebacterium sp. MSK130]MDK8475605.1 amino acid permease [Corynebacterium sp. MSK310]MDK8491276.1 amino acid permease [Corynebacterium sp. MSK175]MDK8647353.1 amino acid permease [Corynebacterium sp. MSK082]MDK8672088.1 amino acid permease [Corynebacterium sp. MSK189]
MAEATQLKSRHLTMMGLGSAVGAGLFLGVGLGIQISGTSVLISYAVAGVLIALIMWMLGEIAAARPSLGSFSTYAGQAFGHWARFTMGWIYWFMLIMVMGAEITGAAAIIGSWFDIAPWIPALIAVAFFAVVNFAAVRGFGEFEFWFAIIKVAVIIAFLVVGILMALGILPGMDLSRAGTNFTDNFLPNGMPGFAAGLLAVAFAFGGIELVTIAAAESEDPARNVATAVRAIIVRIMIFYIGSIVVITMALPFSQIQDADAAANSPFTLVLEAAKIPFAAGFMEAIIALALLSAFNAQIYATSRLVFDMAKDHCAPKFFLKTNHSGSPINAVILSMIFAFASVGLQFWNPPGLLAFLFNAVGGCLLVVWTFIVASFLKLHPQLKANGELTDIRVPGYPWLPWATATALAALTIFMLFDPSARNQVIAVIILFAALVALSFVVPADKREQVRQ